MEAYVGAPGRDEGTSRSLRPVSEYTTNKFEPFELFNHHNSFSKNGTYYKDGSDLTNACCKMDAELSKWVNEAKPKQETVAF